MLPALLEVRVPIRVPVPFGLPGQQVAKGQAWYLLGKPGGENGRDNRRPQS